MSELTQGQLKAIRKLELALIAAGKAGLAGGVYDGSFILWNDLQEFETVVPVVMGGGDVEGAVTLDIPGIDLDGGAGV